MNDYLEVENVTSSVSPEIVKDSSDDEEEISLDQLLQEFFLSEEYIETITETNEIPLEVLSNDDVVDVITDESTLVNEIIMNDNIVQSIAEDTSLVNEVLTNESVAAVLEENEIDVNATDDDISVISEVLNS